MPSNKTQDLMLRTTFFVCGIGILMWGILGVKNRFDPQSKKKNYSRELMYNLDQEMSIANDSNQESYRRGLALRRVSSEAPEMVEKLAFDWLESSSIELKISAIISLSYSKNSNVSEEVAKLVEDENSEVRIQSYNTLFVQKYPPLQGILKSKKIKDLSIDESLKILEILYNLELDSENKYQYLSEIFNFYNEVNTNEKYKILSLLNSIDPDNKKLENILLNLLKHSQNEVLIPTAITLLSKSKNKWLKQNIRNFLFHKSDHIRLVAINSLPSLCSPDTEKLIREILVKESNNQLLHLAVKIKEKLNEIRNCNS